MFLGIDLGTSGVKAVLLDDRHDLVAMADAPLQVSYPQPLWSEQDPQDWWYALEAAVVQLRSLAPQQWLKVQAIGLSGQMHGAVVLNDSMEVLRPAILWNDGRASLECAQLETLVPESRRITGNIAMAGFTAPKLLWMRQHEPDIFRRINKVLLPKDWLRWKLTGELVSDMSDASGTLWLDVKNRCWSEAMLGACGLNQSHMPRLVEGSAVSGYLSTACVQQWGLSANVIVAGGGGDNAASAIGVGAAESGQGFVSLGTSGVIFLVGDCYRSAPEKAVHSFAHALPKRWHQMAVILSAASAFSWVTRLTGSASEAALSERIDAMTSQQRMRAPLFLPYLQGERTPHNNPHARGAFIGLSSSHVASDLGYAVLQGVTLALMDCWQAMGQSQRPDSHLALVGGGSRNNPWAQLVASALGCPIERPDGAQAAAAIGAARLAWLAAGGDEGEVCNSLPADRTFNPCLEQAEVLQEKLLRFRGLYGPVIDAPPEII